MGQWSNESLHEVLSQAKQTGDPWADHVISHWASHHPIDELRALAKSLGDTSIPIPAVFKTELDRALDSEGALAFPNWFDRPTLDKGAAFFKKYWVNLQVMLGCYALPYCYLAEDGVRVLAQSKQLKENTAKRLQLTNDFVLRVVDPSNWDNGLAIQSIVRTRLLHAISRHFIIKHGQWDTTDWGVPINQEDMAGTNLAFSFIAVRGLRKLGYTPSPKEIESYQHLWNAVGYFMGVQDNLLPHSLADSHTLDAAIAKRQFRGSDLGRDLSQALIAGIQSGVPASQKAYIPGFMAYLLGDHYASQLDIRPQTAMQPALSIVLARHKLRNLLGMDDSGKKIPDPITEFVW